MVEGTMVVDIMAGIIRTTIMGITRRCSNSHISTGAKNSQLLLFYHSLFDKKINYILFSKLHTYHPGSIVEKIDFTAKNLDISTKNSPYYIFKPF